MAIYFSGKTLGFFIDQEHGNAIPDDATEITEAHYHTLFDGQSMGKRITSDKTGKPQLIDPLPPSANWLASMERAWRDLQLAQSDGVVLRHRDEMEYGKTTLTDEQYVELQAFRQALRDWPQNESFPTEELRPPAPTWLAASKQ